MTRGAMREFPENRIDRQSSDPLFGERLELEDLRITTCQRREVYAKRNGQYSRDGFVVESWSYDFRKWPWINPSLLLRRVFPAKRRPWFEFFPRFQRLRRRQLRVVPTMLFDGDSLGRFVRENVAPEGVTRAKSQTGGDEAGRR